LPISGLARKGAWLASAEELSKDTPSSIINSSCSSISKTSAQSSSLRISRWSPIERERRGARLCPPTVHNEQSSCRDTVSLWAWWRLPEACGLARLLCDNTGQVALPMTSSPKSLQNGQHSSPISLHVGSENRTQRSGSEIRRSTPSVKNKISY